MQSYPFYKNRYFPHKRMRAADFQRDQELTDGKLAFLSRWVFGEGAALGLGVQREDSEYLLVEPGFAVDGLGRYIVVDQPERRAVRALEGLDGLTGENAVLWLGYAETEQQPMLVPDENGVETEKLSIAREGFRLFLRGPESLTPPAPEALLFSNTVLFADEELRVTQSVPRWFSGAGTTTIRLFLECYEAEPIQIELTYAPSLPGFVGADGNAPFLRQRLDARPGETALTLLVRPAGAARTVPMEVGAGAFVLEKNGQRYEAQSAFRKNFSVAEGEPSAELRDHLAKQELDELWSSAGEGTPLAYVRLIRLGDKCLLDEVTPVSARYRAPVPWFRECAERASACYGAEERPAPVPAPAPPPAPTPAVPEPPPRRMTTGTVTLKAGLDMEAGRVLYSEELSHGLGPGPVLMEFGVENVYPVANIPQNRTDLLLGDVSLFAQPGGTYDAPIERGVRIHPDKGTFELAVRLKGRLRQTALRLRWFAWRPEEALPPPEPPGKLLRLKPDMLRVGPGEAVQFTPVFAEGASAPCEFVVEGRRSGSVTRDGVYTAPDRPGLYMVCARGSGGAEDRAAAFIIVEERGDGAES